MQRYFSPRITRKTANIGFSQPDTTAAQIRPVVRANNSYYSRDSRANLLALFRAVFPGAIGAVE